MNATLEKTLIQRACEVRGRAHAPYSRFHVGAAALTQNGDIFVGCNVENASYGLTVCAERAAVCAAVAAGHQEIIAIAIASQGGHSPCGACRQVLSEFGPAMKVILINADDVATVRTTSLDYLLPEQFSL
jgi:cytidine deaminase